MLREVSGLPRQRAAGTIVTALLGIGKALGCVGGVPSDYMLGTELEL